MNRSSDSELRIAYAEAKYQKLGEMILEKKQGSKCIYDKEIPCQLKVGDAKVFFEYSNNNKTNQKRVLLGKQNLNLLGVLAYVD